MDNVKKVQKNFRLQPGTVEQIKVIQGIFEREGFKKSEADVIEFCVKSMRDALLSPFDMDADKNE